MPDKRFLQLCSDISKERDPEKIVALIEKLVALPEKEQNAIKTNIKANLMSYRGNLPH